MQFEEPLGEREAEADAVVSAGEARIYLTKWRQRDRHPVCRDPDPGIFDMDADAAVRFLLRCQPDLAACGSELNRVGQKVDEDLPQLCRIAPEERQVILNVERALNFGLLGQGADHAGAERDRAHDIDLLFGQFETAGLRSGNIENIVNYREEMAP